MLLPILWRREETKKREKKENTRSIKDNCSWGKRKNRGQEELKRTDRDKMMEERWSEEDQPRGECTQTSSPLHTPPLTTSIW